MCVRQIFECVGLEHRESYTTERIYTALTHTIHNTRRVPNMHAYRKKIGK